jgi:hypothetical protein
MRRRTKRVYIFMDDAEHRRYMRLVERSGLTQQSYVRHLINGVIPADRPPPDFYQMMRELHSIGNNLNQIAHHAHATGIVDEARYWRNVTKLDEAIRHISSEVLSPKKRE